MHLKKTFILVSILLSMLLIWSACGSDSAAQQETNTDSTEKNISPATEIVAVNISDTEKIPESNTANTEKKTPKDEKEVAVTPKKEEKKEVKKKKKERKKRAKMHFSEKIYDYGFIMQGDTVTHDFYFKNVGSADLVITNVKPSCGCTVPIFPKEPIPPGQEGKISVMFKSAGKLGRQVPNITVYTNYKRKIKLELKGYVDAERAKKKPVIVDEKKENL